MRHTFQPRLPNLLPMQGGLGSRSATVRLPVAQSKLPAGTSSQVAGVGNMRPAGNASGNLHVYRLDELFVEHWPGERLGFAHFDVEGAEADVLEGAANVIRRDRPVFTVEVFVHNRPQ